MNSLIERHQEMIAGVVLCLHRVTIAGTLPEIGYAEVLAGYPS
jgi:hypothetical protein